MRRLLSDFAAVAPVRASKVGEVVTAMEVDAAQSLCPGYGVVQPRNGPTPRLTVGGDAAVRRRGVVASVSGRSRLAQQVASRRGDAPARDRASPARRCTSARRAVVNVTYAWP